MSKYCFFTNGVVKFGLLQSSTPKMYREQSEAVFLDLDNENLRFVVDFWRNNCIATCKEQQRYDLVRMTMQNTFVTVMVGHREFKTTKETLEKIPYFDAAFRNNSDLSINLDRDDKYFERLLSHCRHPLEHPLHKLDISVDELSFYGLTPKYLQLWINPQEKGENDTTARPFADSDRNSMHPALHSAVEISLFLFPHRRYFEFSKNTVFLEEMDREKAVDGLLGDTVFFSSENIDTKMVDIMNRFCLVFESDVNIHSLEDIFGNAYMSLYSDDESKQRALNSFRKETRIVPLKTRHAQILHYDGGDLVCFNSRVYGEVKSKLVFDYHNDLEEITTPRKIPEITFGREVTISMSCGLQQCLCDLMQIPSFLKYQRGNKYYINVPLHFFFTNDVWQKGNFLNLRKRFEFQLRLDSVKIPKLRLMLNTIQLTEEEQEATIQRENEQLVQVFYDVFHEDCIDGKLQKSWKTSMPYTISCFIIQVCDIESGERLDVNVKGSFKIKNQVFPFNIHTNQAAQADVFGLRVYNPFVWVIPFGLKANNQQPTGTLFTTSDTEMAVQLECDTTNVNFNCWMSCYRCFCQKFEPNEIGFLNDVDVERPDPTLFGQRDLRLENYRPYPSNVYLPQEDENQEEIYVEQSREQYLCQNSE